MCLSLSEGVQGPWFCPFVLVISLSRNGQFLSFVDKEWTVLEFRSRIDSLLVFPGSNFLSYYFVCNLSKGCVIFLVLFLWLPEPGMWAGFMVCFPFLAGVCACFNW